MNSRVTNLLTGMFIGALCLGGTFHMGHRLREAREWVTECAAIDDPWQRFEKLALMERPTLDEDQEAWRKEQSTAALSTALTQRSSAAFDLIERWQGTYADLVDKYPRDPLQRKKQLAALGVLWPDIHEMPTKDRVVLLHMATRCHLHEAETPVASQAVLDCLRYGAQDLGAQQELTRLMDSALLFRPLMAAP